MPDQTPYTRPGQASVDLPTFIRPNPGTHTQPAGYKASDPRGVNPPLPAFLSGEKTPDLLVSPYNPPDRRPRPARPEPQGYGPVAPGKTRQIPRHKPRPEKIRTGKQTGSRVAGQSGYGNTFGFDQMTRTEALYRVRGALRRHPAHPNALRLIDLFQLHPEELSEAGVPYETLKSLASLYAL